MLGFSINLHTGMSEKEIAELKSEVEVLSSEFAKAKGEVATIQAYYSLGAT